VRNWKIILPKDGQSGWFGLNFRLTANYHQLQA
jgi:hypothetical protein